ncbi:MAG TPA: hypothetical protein VF836_06600 [Gemmatimonadaceae bacterium]
MDAKHLDRPTEDQVERIGVIDAWESLGYRGVGREEHSGENAPHEPADLDGELADNARGQITFAR